MFWLPAAIGAGASIIGNIFGSSNTKKTNNNNLRIAQLNNEFNERMIDKQNEYNIDQWNREAAYNTDMWNKTNEYNSASAQAQRYRDAGLNPALMMQNGSAGIATSSSAPSGNGVSAPQASQVSMQSFTPDFSGIGQAITSAMQIRQLEKQTDADSSLKQVQAEQVHIENQYRAQKLMQELYESQSRVRDNDAKSAINRIIAQNQDAVMKSLIAREQASTRNIEQNTLNAVKQGLMFDKELAIFDERTRLELANISAETMLKLAQGQLTKEQAKHEIVKSIETVSRTHGIKLNNTLQERIADSLVDKAYKDAYGFDGYAKDLNMIGTQIRRLKRMFGK